MPGPNGPTPEQTPRWPRLSLRLVDQGAAAGLLVAALLAIGVYWVWQGRLRTRVIDIDRAPSVAIDFKIDINAADWPELCLMPGVGEQLARRIVEHRAEHGPFRDLKDLRKVRGIGPKTFDGMVPYLSPLADLEATAGENSGGLTGEGVN
ncbi:MAG: helix-hairpin-helix domain-containing protein [Pirellulaceae bacterium]|nr:helix-hairpin-helix domain-containing protein [Pirellulaceae bacterium]